MKGGASLTRFSSLLQINLLDTMQYRFSRKVDVDLTAYRNTVIKVRPTARITGGGKLRVGLTWPAFCHDKTLLAVWDRGSLTVTSEFFIYCGCKIVIDEGARLEVGHAHINSNSTIACFNHIKIGNHVFIGENVTIRDSDNHCILNAPRGVSEPIIIGDHVWIGINAIILKGATIGSGSIIAAGSVVTKSIPEHVLAGGVPAKVIREDVDWRE
jgi:acetyltransferase-like isoleucine patch superfamily enzyme